MLILVLLAVPAGLFVVNRQPVDALPCPCNLFSAPSGQSDFNDGTDLELGFKFSADVDGYITGVRFYKQGAMSGTHIGNLWTIGGSNLATATFSETASGWQEVSFGTPVAVTAGVTYVASVSMPDGRYIATTNYFATAITNFPLRAPASVGSGGNGVFGLNAGDFPTNSSNAANYWVDVAYTGNIGLTAPTVDSTTPAADATGINPGQTVSATFDDAMDQTTITTSTFTVRDSGNSPVPGAVTYNNTTKTASFAADEGFSLDETYTVTLEGGTGSVVTNMEGVALAADYEWLFTVGSTNACPCSLKDEANPAGAGTFDDSGELELGIKIKPAANGYITAVRFYKPIISTEGTHNVRIWSSTGSNLATATTANETEYGWQEAKLSSPLRVTQGQLYIVSYTTTTAVYMASANALDTNIIGGYLTAYQTGSSENAATGSNNLNGVFSTSAGSYPASGSPNGSYYWVDAVFSIGSSPADPLEVTLTRPTADAYGVERTKPVKATFNRALNSSTVTNTTVRLFDSNNVQISGTASYEASSHSAVFTPDNPLTYSQQYTARLDAAIEDVDGAQLGSEYTWSFTVGKQLATDINQGPGGPVLVVTSTANKYSPYYAEILRTEGINYFETKDISTVSATTLDSYDAVVLAEMTLTQGQVDMFTEWVTSDGGNLVAMRPDKKFAGLLGLTDAGTTRTNQYLRVTTTAAPGTGIVGESIQFKGTADNYVSSGATEVAQLYADAATATSNPAVTIQQVGSNGGTAAAFSYDLAKSVIALHQGNQAWAGDERDGSSPRRSNDMFFGAKAGDIQPDWVNLDKIHIPQADEQQRLLANVLIEAGKDRRPLPRFWYLPYEYKAAMLMAGDDHDQNNANGTERIFNNWLNESTTWCELDKWECVRASDYNYVGSDLTAARALQYHNLDFEVADHPTTGCANFTSYAALGTIFTNDLTVWRAKYAGLPNQRTNRFHCYLWSDWDSMARVEYDNGMRYDLNYTTYPSSWIGTRAAVITGSGMNMRLSDADGDMLDVYQGVTNFENSVTGAAAIDTVLDNATGPLGYYGIYGTHYDMSDSYHTTLFNQAKANNVPVISAEQALVWLDGRNSSEFSNFGGGDGRFTFDIETGMGAQGLRAMMPVQDAGGTLTGITRGGDAVSYQTQAVKGVQYAIFDGRPGSYTVTYSDYDSDPDDDGGNAGTDDSSSDDGSSSPTTPRKKIGTTVLDGQPPATGDSSVPQPDKNQNEDDNGSEEKPQEADETKPGFPWGWWLTGFGLLAAILGAWLFFWLKRRRADRSIW
jgi:hypothetical protein